METAEALRVGFLGRIPPALGGAGLEVQMSRTADALERLGHEVVWVDAAPREAALDILHAFGSEPAVWHQLRHWTRNRVPLVLTSVIVVSPGRDELLMRLAARVPGATTSSRMRSDLVRRCDALVAGTEYERDLAVKAFGADPALTTVIGNGADRVEPAALPDGLPEGPFALMVGAVSARKRQADVARAVSSRLPVVVAGGFAGSETERAAWDRVAALPGVVWLGHVADRATVAALQRSAAAMVHSSDAEVESLAVLECLAQGTPAVLSDIPSHRALASRYPGFVELVRRPDAVAPAIERLLRERPPAAPRVPSWEDVARQLVGVYRSALASR